jgi:cytochrome c-type biogenesis protein CcsB
LEKTELILLLAFGVCYAAAMIAYIALLVTRSRAAGVIGTVLLVLGLTAQTGALLFRGVKEGRLPLTSGYEMLSCTIWGIGIVYLVLELAQKQRQLGAFVLPVMFSLSLLTWHWKEGIERLLNPALKNPFWLSVHVSTAIIAYGGFGVAFALGVAYLLISRRQSGGRAGFLASRLPSPEWLDANMHKVIAFAFIFQTLLVVTGAIWAESAWGQYWSWDPKEVWSLITWLIYALYLHGRLSRGWKGIVAAWINVLGFVVVLFTLFGVNYLLPGLHSYGRLSG